MIEPAPDPLARLRRVAEFQRAVACGLSSAPELAADLAWHADALAAVAAGADPARAFGLRRGPGQRTPATTERTRLRDAMLQEACRTHFADLSVSAAAVALLDVVKRCDRRSTAPSQDGPEALVMEAGCLARVPRTRQRLSAILQGAQSAGK